MYDDPLDLTDRRIDRADVGKCDLELEQACPHRHAGDRSRERIEYQAIGKRTGGQAPVVRRHATGSDERVTIGGANGRVPQTALSNPEGFKSGARAQRISHRLSTQEIELGGDPSSV